MGLATQEIKGFLGVNLSKDRLNLADDELAKAINADLHSQPGTILLRYSKNKQFSSGLGSSIRKLAKINSKRYQAAGTVLYRDQASILTGLSSNLITSVIPYRPLLDTTLWAFIADDAKMQKDNGTTLRKWGITAPIATPSFVSITGGAGSLSAGTYKWKMTFVRKDGSTIAHESNPSVPNSKSGVVANDRINIGSLEVSSDPQVDYKRLYRTVANGAAFLFEKEVTNATTTSTLDIADTALGSEVETDNDVPNNCSWATEYQSHIFLCRDGSNKHYLWYSKKFRPEAVPVGNFLEIGNPDDPLQCAMPISGMLGVFSRITKYRVVGNSISGFVAQEALTRRGTPSPMSLAISQGNGIFVARDGVFMTNLLSADVNISEDIAPLFRNETVNGMSPINWNYASLISGGVFKQRYYFAYPSGSSGTPDKVGIYSSHTQKWYFFDFPVTSFLYEEDIDDFVAGSTNGLVYVLEEGVTGDDLGTAISLEVETKDYYGESCKIRKIFQYFKVDTDTDGGTITAKVYIDGILKQTTSITGNRTRQLLPLPESLMGYSWRINLFYMGIGRPKIYGVGILYLPLGSN